MQLQPVSFGASQSGNIILQSVSHPIYVQPLTVTQPQFISFSSPQRLDNIFPPPPYQNTPPLNKENMFPNNWSSGLCSCCEDFGICIYAALCPCCLYGKNSKKIGEGTCIGKCLCYLFCFPCCQQTKTRYLIRKKYNLLEEPCNDCCISWFCSLCALCQEAREIKYRDYIQKPEQQYMK
jgi:Cys-rich protein (TIGR01571 family)